ncbi:hypothetical protein GF325_18050 [Candidatus Bathyarchaeota archaeon]|nr:hypothetical protein [Candidatus Bathyarchaeota archaeon]
MNIIYILPLFVIGGVFLLIVNKKRKERQSQGAKRPASAEDIESLANPAAITAILFITLIYVTFFSGFTPIMPTPLDLITIVWYALFIIVFYFICRKEKRRYTGPRQELKIEKNLSLKYELIRKLTHLVIGMIIVCYTIIGPIFMNFMNFMLDAVPFFGISSLNVDPIYYGHYTVVFLVVISFLGLSTSEIVRVFFYPAYPLKAVKAIYRQKEIGAALGSHISLTVGVMAVILVYGPHYPDIVVASVSISAIADAAANLVGKKFGKHEYRTAISKKRKTFEGMLSATIVSFLLSLLFLIYRFGTYSFLLGFVAAGVMVLIDWLSPQVSDNLLNPLLTSTAMVIVAKILLLP